MLKAAPIQLLILNIPQSFAVGGGRGSVTTNPPAGDTVVAFPELGKRAAQDDCADTPVRPSAVLLVTQSL